MSKTAEKMGMSEYQKRCPIDGGTCGQGGTCYVCENEALGSELTAAKARIAYLEQLAAGRLAQNTADAERIAELEKALEPFAREEIGTMYKDPWHLQFSDPDGFVDFTDFTIGDLRRAAELLEGE